MIIDPYSDVIEKRLNIDNSWKLLQSDINDIWSEGLRERVLPTV